MFFNQLAGFFLIAAIGFGGWQTVKQYGYKAQAERAEAKLTECTNGLALASSNNVTLKAAIDQQNDSIELAKLEANMKRLKALAERDTALNALSQAKNDYALLRKNWPRDCVAAVTIVRKELGL